MSDNVFDAAKLLQLELDGHIKASSRRRQIRFMTSCRGTARWARSPRAPTC